MLEQIALIRILLANIDNNYRLAMQENDYLRKENQRLNLELNKLKENVNRTSEQCDSKSETSN